MVSFTGSTSVGQIIAEGAGRGMKRLLLELGGKGAAIVFEDADISAAVTGIGSTWSFHSGQICTAPTRAIVHRSKYDEVVDKLAAYAQVCKVGDPLAADTLVGPVISGTQRDRVEALIDAGKDAGAEVVVGGARPDMERGYYVAPTLMTAHRRRQPGGAEGILRSGRHGVAVRRRGRGDRDRKRHVLRPVRLRLVGRHGARLSGRQPVADRHGRRSTPRSATTRRRSAVSSSAVSAGTAGPSGCTHIRKCRASSGRPDPVTRPWSCRTLAAVVPIRQAEVRAVEALMSTEAAQPVERLPEPRKLGCSHGRSGAASRTRHRAGRPCCIFTDGVSGWHAADAVGSDRGRRPGRPLPFRDADGDRLADREDARRCRQGMDR